MPRKITVLIAVILTVFALSACGGGSGGGGGGSADLPQTLTVSGNAIKGPIEGAEIKIFYFDVSGNEVEIVAQNAPVITGSSGGYTFKTNSSDFDDITSPLIVRTVGGTMGNLSASAPTLEAVIADPTILTSQNYTVSAHLSSASSVAAGLLKKIAQTTGESPTSEDAETYIERVETQFGIDLVQDPADGVQSVAMVNECVDQNLDLMNTPDNNHAVDDYIEYMVANLGSTSGALDGEMSNPNDLGTDTVVSFEAFGGGKLAALFPEGPTAFENLIFYTDKTAIENNGLDYAALTATLMNAAGRPVGDGTVIHFSIISGEGILSETAPATTNGQAVVNFTSIWPGDVVVQASYDLANGNTIRQQIPVTVTDLEEDVVDTEPPGVVSAGSISNTEVFVTFSEPMRGGPEGVENPDLYRIVSDGSTPSQATLVVKKAELLLPERNAVKLTTLSQSDIEYTLTVTNVKDLAGNPIAPPSRYTDPSTVTFFGRPPLLDDQVDTDGDGLSDAAEQFGWIVTVVLPNGEEIPNKVTSDPENPDTDGDGVSDFDEKAFLSDPRNQDTDGDQLTDSQELNEIYSNPFAQDTDHDGLSDGLEFNFFHTSPILSDTDGDQIADDDEVVLATRNARVADLPAPTIEVGEINLQLDVRFTESTSLETRELETKNVSTTLTQSDKQEYSNTNSNKQEAMAKLSVGTGYKVKGDIFGPGGTWNTNIKFDTGWTGSWTSSNTKTSSQATQRAFAESLTTSVATTEGSTVTRKVASAMMQATVFIKNAGNLAYSIRNLQVTAFIQDPQDPTRLKPVATLLPDQEPAEGFTLGPLVPARGPFIFSNDLIFPQLVESLMKNPRGLVFVISNYDITDELGRDFAFSSQEVVERTTNLVIDFGSFDSDGDGEGDLTEYHRIATGSGRRIDTNGDGNVDGNDRWVVFDDKGKQIGITLRDALNAIGLTYYNEEATPTSSLSEQETRNSYSTIIDNAGVERFFRVREAALENGAPKTWEILTPTGIDQTVGPDDFILGTEDDIKLAFVQDVDQDRLVASLEFVNNCSDILADTDGDGLDDRLETLIGWQVQTSSGSRQVFSMCSMADSDGDSLTDAEEAGAPIDCDGDGNPDATWFTDPGSSDTDSDGITDKDEICGYDVTLRNFGTTITVTTDPTNRDTDGDTASDGVERRLGGNPTDSSDINQFADADGDGLVNFQETDGWDIMVYGVSAAPVICNTVCDQGPAVLRHVISDPYNADTDGDGLPDGEEKTLNTDPDNQDTDSDGLTDFQEVRGFNLPDQGIITLDPNDADTDNDKRSDGDESELVDLVVNRWIVRVVGENPYRVFSDPLQPDQDYDTVVDGDEFRQGSDPTLANTDGDRRDDALEIALGLNPLQADFMVTVFFRSILILTPGEAILNDFLCTSNPSNCGDGEISFQLNVRLPDDTTTTGLESTPTTVATDWGIKGYMPVCAIRTDLFTLYNSFYHIPTPCWSASDDGIQMYRDDELKLFDSQYNIPENLQSITFSMTEDQRFSIEGRIGEFDVQTSFDLRPTGYHWIDFGGLDGIKADDQNGAQVTAVFEGSDVKLQTIEDFIFKFSDPSWGELDPFFNTNIGNGEVRVRYIVE